MRLLFSNPPAIGRIRGHSLHRLILSKRIKCFITWIDQRVIMFLSRNVLKRIASKIRNKFLIEHYLCLKCDRYHQALTYISVKHACIALF